MKNPLKADHEKCNCYFCCLDQGYEKFMDIKEKK